MCLRVIAVVAGVFAGAASLAAAAPVPAVCQPAIDAQIKVFSTPHHMVSKEGDPPRVAETITADGANYVRIRDKWMKSPIESPQQYLAQEQENIKNATAYNCSRLADEMVDGTPANVYKVHSETPDVASADAQLWISKATGLPLRTEEDITEAGGSKRHFSIKYDYANIKAPALK